MTTRSPATKIGILSLLFLTSFSSQLSAAELIVCTRSKLDEFRAVAQSLEKSTPRLAKKLTVCSSFADEVGFWLAFYHAVGSAPNVGASVPSIQSGEDKSGQAFSGAAGDLRAARLAARQEKWSEARIRYDAYNSKRPTDHQVLVERTYTIIWEKKFLDAEKQFDGLLKSNLPAKFQLEASRGKNTAVALQKSAPNSTGHDLVDPNSVESNDGANVSEGNWVTSPSLSYREGSDTLSALTLGVKSQRIEKGQFDDQISFDINGTKVVSNALGSRTHLLVAGVSAASRLDFGEGFKLNGRIGFYGVESGLVHGEVKSSFRILPKGFAGTTESRFVVGAGRLPLFFSMPLSRGDLAVSRDTVFTELNLGRWVEVRYALGREKSFATHDRVDLNSRWKLTGTEPSGSLESSKIESFSTSVVVLTSSESHPKPNPFYLTQDRVDVVRVGYELLHSAQARTLSGFSLLADVGTAFVKSRYPSGKDSQVGVWGIKASMRNSWSRSLRSTVDLVNQASTRNVNDSILRRATTIQLSMGWIL